MKIFDYREDFGNVCFADGFVQIISGKPLEKQMEHFRIRIRSTIEKYSYGKLDSERSWEKEYGLDECDDVNGVIVKDGLIAGVMLKTQSGDNRACLPEQSVTIYYADEDDGPGGSSRNDVAKLLCV